MTEMLWQEEVKKDGTIDPETGLPLLKGGCIWKIEGNTAIIYYEPRWSDWQEREFHPSIGFYNPPASINGVYLRGTQEVVERETKTVTKTVRKFFREKTVEVEMVREKRATEAERYQHSLPIDKDNIVRVCQITLGVWAKRIRGMMEAAERAPLQGFYPPNKVEEVAK